MKDHLKRMIKTFYYILADRRVWMLGKGSFNSIVLSCLRHVFLCTKLRLFCKLLLLIIFTFYISLGFQIFWPRASLKRHVLSKCASGAGKIGTVNVIPVSYKYLISFISVLFLFNFFYFLRNNFASYDSEFLVCILILLYRVLFSLFLSHFYLYFKDFRNNKLFKRLL